MDLETFREQLVIWGITPKILIVIGVLSIVTLFFSLRIVTKWFLGIQYLQDELGLMRKQLTDIQTQISMTKTTLREDLDDESEESTPQKRSTNDSFRLTNH
jgi:hypothetical protein